MSQQRLEQQFPYPVDAFPPVVADVINALHEETQMPIEMIGSTVLAALSLACQSIIEVIPPHSNTPEQCSLYLLTIAESGEGKTTINKRVMKPFYDFSSTMRQEYQEQLLTYKDKHNIWETKLQGLRSNLRSASKKGHCTEEAEASITEHNKKEPKKPIQPKIIYEDATPKALIEGLNEYSEAGIISDEAITFFKGYIKNNLGLLNKAWDGEVYNYHRPGKEEYDIKACLTLSLMAQPNVFIDYLKKHGDIAKGSGFLSRFLFTNTVTTIGTRQGNTDYSKSDEALKVLHGRLSVLLKQKKARFNDSSSEKVKLELTDETKLIWKEKRAEIERKIAKGQEWEHIKDIASKAGANAIRIAGVTYYIYNNNDPIIPSDFLINAYKIMDWYLNQASELFYPISERYQFEQDVYELFEWLKKQLFNNKQEPLLVNFILGYGPKRFRKSENLMPVLNKLINLGLFLFVKTSPHGALFLARTHPLNKRTPFSSSGISYFIVPLDQNVLIKSCKLDLTRFYY